MYNLKRLVAWSLVIIAMVVGIFSPPQTAYAANRRQEATKEFTYKDYKKISRKIWVGMRVDKPSALSEENFVRMIKLFKYDYKGFLKRNARFIWKMGWKYKIDPLFYIGIFGVESGWGQCGWSNNYTGMIGCRFSSEEEGIEATFKNLSKNYVKQGRRTILKIGPKYCETWTWPWQVKKAMKMVIEPSCQKPPKKIVAKIETKTTKNKKTTKKTVKSMNKTATMKLGEVRN